MNNQETDELLLQLKDYGADLDGAMGRFLNDVDLYKHCLVLTRQDKHFQLLGEAISAQDYQKAFECAHTLKGVVGNMGLTPLYQVLCRLVEALRGGDYTNLQYLYEITMAELKKVEDIQL